MVKTSIYRKVFYFLIYTPWTYETIGQGNEREENKTEETTKKEDKEKTSKLERKGEMEGNERGGEWNWYY
jgi:hypothetical protein